MKKIFLALFFILNLTGLAEAQSQRNPCYNTGTPVNCVPVGTNSPLPVTLNGSTGSVFQSNASSGVAPTSSNLPTIGYNYLWNGASWDQSQGLQVGTAGAPALDVLTIQSPITLGSAGFPTASTPISNSSGNIAAATATATLAANSTKFTYICGLSITSSGSTSAAVVSPTVTGLISGTMTFTYTTVAGVTLANLPLIVPFSPCVPSSAVNTAIVVSMPSLGTGNTNTTVSAWGFQQ